MRTINVEYDADEDVTVTINGVPVSGAAALPGSAAADPDISTALADLTAQYGAVAVQHMIRAVRDNGNGPAISEFLAVEAAKEIAAVMKSKPGTKYAAARLIVAGRWGYTGTSITNFNKIADKGWYAMHGAAE